MFAIFENCADPRKVGQNFERRFANSIKFSQLNSKRASKFRRLFQKGLKKNQRLLQNLGRTTHRHSQIAVYEDQQYTCKNLGQTTPRYAQIEVLNYEVQQYTCKKNSGEQLIAVPNSST